MWARLDDGFHAHRKVGDLDPVFYLVCCGLHSLALSWCGEQTTDGYVPKGQLVKLAGDVGAILPGKTAYDLAAELVRVGMWEKKGTGFQIHDFLDYNPSRAQVLARQADKVTWGRMGAIARWGSEGDGSSYSSEEAEAIGSTMAGVYPEPEPEPEPEIRNPKKGGARGKKRLAPADKLEKLRVYYLECCPSLPKIQPVSEMQRPRKEHMSAFLKILKTEHEVRSFFQRVEASDFLAGRSPGDRAWQATFDWVIKPSNVVKIMEGNYDNRRSFTKVESNVRKALEIAERSGDE